MMVAGITALLRETSHEINQLGVKGGQNTTIATIVIVDNTSTMISSTDFSHSCRIIAKGKKRPVLNRKQKIVLRNKQRQKSCENATGVIHLGSKTRGEHQVGCGPLPPPPRPELHFTRVAAAVQSIAQLLTKQATPQRLNETAEPATATSRLSTMASSLWDAIPTFSFDLAQAEANVLPSQSAVIPLASTFPRWITPASRRSASAHDADTHSKSEDNRPTYLEHKSTDNEAALTEQLAGLPLPLTQTEKHNLVEKLKNQHVFFFIQDEPQADAQATRRKRKLDSTPKRTIKTMVVIAEQDPATATVIRWGDKQMQASHLLFRYGVESGDPVAFLASGGEAVLGFFAQTLGKIMDGSLLDKEPNETNAEWLLRLTSNVVMPPEAVAGQAFKIASRLDPGLQGASKVPALRGASVTHEATGIMVQPILETDIQGQKWQLIPESGNKGYLIPQSVGFAERSATRNPLNGKWAVSGLPGEHSFLLSTNEAKIYIKIDNQYYPATRHLSDGTFSLSNGRKIYLNQGTKEWKEFCPGNSHLNARSLSALPAQLLSAAPANNAVLSINGIASLAQIDSLSLLNVYINQLIKMQYTLTLPRFSDISVESKIWTQPATGKRYLEVQKPDPINLNNVVVEYIEGKLEGLFFSIEQPGQPASQQTVLQWQSGTRQWEVASPFEMLKNAESKIAHNPLMSTRAIADDLLTEVTGRPGLYQTAAGTHYLRWQMTAEGHRQYIPLFSTSVADVYRLTFPTGKGKAQLYPLLVYDSGINKWLFKEVTSPAFISLPQNVLIQPTEIFDQSYILHGDEYKNVYLGRHIEDVNKQNIYIHTGNNKKGVAEYITVKQHAVDKKLFELRVPSKTAEQPSEVRVYRYQNDGEFTLEQNIVCRRVKRANGQDGCEPETFANVPSQTVENKWQQVENVHFLGKGSYVNSENSRDTYFCFDNTIRDNKRLNIVAHARMEPGQNTATVGFENVASRYTGDSFAKYVGDMGVRFEEYQHARLFICYSADGGANSFASKFAISSGLETEGFYGTLEIEGTLQSMVNSHTLPLNLKNLFADDLMAAEEGLNEALEEADNNNFLRLASEYSSAHFAPHPP